MSFQQSGDAAVDEKLCLRGVAKNVQSGIDAGFRDGGEIDMRRQVLQAGQEKRFIVRAVAVVAHQRSLRTLWMVVLAPAEPVVDQQ